MAGEQKKGATSAAHKAFTVVGVVLCIVLVPILALNLVLLAKSYLDPNKVPDAGGVVPLIVLSDSMAPEINSGDLIICNTCDASEVKLGDVISFFDPASSGSSVVTHRVVEVTEKDGELAWITKGDANNANDPNPVPASELVARYSGTCLAGMGNAVMFMQTPTGLVLCVVLPLVLLVGYDVIRRRLFDKKHAAEAQALQDELEELRRLKAERDKEE